jgi:hypothetical protein
MPPPSQPQATKRPQTIEQAIYAITKAIQAEMKPISALATMATDPRHPSPLDLMVQLLETVVSGQNQTREQVEAILARLDEPQIKKAIKEAVTD